LKLIPVIKDIKRINMDKKYVKKVNYDERERKKERDSYSF
jgi:hypothetical protein